MTERGVGPAGSSTHAGWASSPRMKASVRLRAAGMISATLFGGAGLVAAQNATPPPRPMPTSSPAAAPAPVSSEPQATTATFGDWVLRCERATIAGQSQRVCEVGQTLEAKGQGIVAQIALGRLSPKDPLRLTIALPPNVSLTSGVRVALDDKDDNPAELTWKRCVPGGCFAEADIRDEHLKAWRAQSGTGQIRYVAASDQPLRVAFSFRGLGVALENLAKAATTQ